MFTHLSEYLDKLKKQNPLILEKKLIPGTNWSLLVEHLFFSMCSNPKRLMQILVVFVSVVMRRYLF